MQSTVRYIYRLYIFSIFAIAHAVESYIWTPSRANLEIEQQHLLPCHTFILTTDCKQILNQAHTLVQQKDAALLLQKCNVYKKTRGSTLPEQLLFLKIISQ